MAAPNSPAGSLDPAFVAALASLREMATSADDPGWIEETLGINIDIDDALFRHRKRFGRRALHRTERTVVFELTWRAKRRASS